MFFHFPVFSLLLLDLVTQCTFDYLGSCPPGLFFFFFFSIFRIKVSCISLLPIRPSTHPSIRIYKLLIHHNSSKKPAWVRIDHQRLRAAMARPLFSPLDILRKAQHSHKVTIAVRLHLIRNCPAAIVRSYQSMNPTSIAPSFQHARCLVLNLIQPLSPPSLQNFLQGKIQKQPDQISCMLFEICFSGYVVADVCTVDILYPTSRMK